MAHQAPVEDKSTSSSLNYASSSTDPEKLAAYRQIATLPNGSQGIATTMLDIDIESGHVGPTMLSPEVVVSRKHSFQESSLTSHDWRIVQLTTSDASGTATAAPPHCAKHPIDAGKDTDTPRPLPPRTHRSASFGTDVLVERKQDFSSSIASTTPPATSSSSSSSSTLSPNLGPEFLLNNGATEKHLISSGNHHTASAPLNASSFSANHSQSLSFSSGSFHPGPSSLLVSTNNDEEQEVHVSGRHSNYILSPRLEDLPLDDPHEPGARIQDTHQRFSERGGGLGSCLSSCGRRSSYTNTKPSYYAAPTAATGNDSSDSNAPPWYQRWWPMSMVSRAFCCGRRRRVGDEEVPDSPTRGSPYSSEHGYTQQRGIRVLDVKYQLDSEPHHASSANASANAYQSTTAIAARGERDGAGMLYQHHSQQLSRYGGSSEWDQEAQQRSTHSPYTGIHDNRARTSISPPTPTATSNTSSNGSRRKGKSGGSPWSAAPTTTSSTIHDVWGGHRSSETAVVTPHRGGQMPNGYYSAGLAHGGSAASASLMTPAAAGAGRTTTPTPMYYTSANTAVTPAGYHYQQHNHHQQHHAYSSSSSASMYPHKAGGQTGGDMQDRLLEPSSPSSIPMSHTQSAYTTSAKSHTSSEYTATTATATATPLSSSSSSAAAASPFQHGVTPPTTSTPHLHTTSATSPASQTSVPLAGDVSGASHTPSRRKGGKGGGGGAGHQPDEVTAQALTRETLSAPGIVMKTPRWAIERQPLSSLNGGGSSSAKAGVKNKAEQQSTRTMESTSTAATVVSSSSSSSSSSSPPSSLHDTASYSGSDGDEGSSSARGSDSEHSTRKKPPTRLLVHDEET